MCRAKKMGWQRQHHLSMKMVRCCISGLNSITTLPRLTRIVNCSISIPKSSWIHGIQHSGRWNANGQIHQSSRSNRQWRSIQRQRTFSQSPWSHGWVWLGKNSLPIQDGCCPRSNIIVQQNSQECRHFLDRVELTLVQAAVIGDDKSGGTFKYQAVAGIDWLLY